MTEIKVFGAEWCGPCGQLKSALKDEGLWSEVTYIDVETDDGQEEANFYQVSGLPTVVITNGGKENVEELLKGAGGNTIETIKEYA